MVCCMDGWTKGRETKKQTQGGGGGRLTNNYRRSRQWTNRGTLGRTEVGGLSEGPTDWQTLRQRDGQRDRSPELQTGDH